MDSLGEEYGLEDLRAVLSGKKAHTPRKKTVTQAEPPKINLLVDIQAKLQAGKGAGDTRWAKVFNLKQMAQTKAAEKRMAEIAVLRTHIVNYAKTREVYVAYRKAGYSKKFREEGFIFPFSILAICFTETWLRSESSCCVSSLFFRVSRIFFPKAVKSSIGIIVHLNNVVSFRFM